jgi:hypothetical protein
VEFQPSFFSSASIAILDTFSATHHLQASSDCIIILPIIIVISIGDGDPQRRACFNGRAARLGASS